MGEYLSFRKMITPVFIQVIFWIAVVVILLLSFATLANSGIIAAVGLLVVGLVGARVYAELLLVIFRINENVQAIAERSGAAPQPAAAPPATPPPPAGL